MKKIISLCHLTPKECPEIEIDDSKIKNKQVRIFDEATKEEIFMSQENFANFIKKAKDGELD